MSKNILITLIVALCFLYNTAVISAEPSPGLSTLLEQAKALILKKDYRSIKNSLQRHEELYAGNPNFTQLETLILNNNQITSIPVSTLPTTLTTLNLNNNISIIAADFLPNSLTTLKLANNIIAETEDISDLTNLTSLTILDLGANTISSIGSPVLLPLEELYISGVSLDDKSGLDNFDALLGLIDTFTDGYQSLTKLGISFTSIENTTYSQLLSELPDLTPINKDGC